MSTSSPHQPSLTPDWVPPEPPPLFAPEATGTRPSVPSFPIIKLSNNKAQMDITLMTRPVPLKKNPRGYEEKLFINLTNYDLSHKTPNTFLSHAVDGPTFRMLASIILRGAFPEAITQGLFGPEPNAKVTASPQNPNIHSYQWKEFKGSPDKNQQIISRILTLTYNDTPGHKYPWSVMLTAGPGRSGPTGAVMPASTPTDKVQIQLNPSQMHQWMLLGTEALQALTITQMLRLPWAPAPV